MGRVSVVRWLLAPLDDRLRGLSLTRILAVLCFVFVGHSVWHERALTWIDFWVLALGIATAYGKKVLLAFFSRIGLSRVTPSVTAPFDATREPSPQDDERG